MVPNIFCEKVYSIYFLKVRFNGKSTLYVCICTYTHVCKRTHPQTKKVVNNIATFGLSILIRSSTLLRLKDGTYKIAKAETNALLMVIETLSGQGQTVITNIFTWVKASSQF